MSYRPDAPAFNKPTLLTEPSIVTLSTDDAPEVDSAGGVLEVGQTWRHEDTGTTYYWDGDAWKPVAVEQADGLKLSLLFEIRNLLAAMVGDVE